MPNVVAYDEVKAFTEHRVGTNSEQWRTFFMRPGKKGVPRNPYAFLSEGSPHRRLVPHYHAIDQFQVIVRGDGLMGRHKLAPYAVHFSRANTPYGPLVGGEQGLGFLTLRSMGDPSGQHHLPKAMPDLLGIPDREPWQISEVAKFEARGPAFAKAFEKIRDERGLAAFSVHLEADAKLSAPDPSKSDGQYIVITRGSLRYQGQEKKALTIIFVKPEEGPFELAAGNDGLEALVLNFPTPSYVSDQFREQSMTAV